MIFFNVLGIALISAGILLGLLVVAPLDYAVRTVVGESQWLDRVYLLLMGIAFMAPDVWWRLARNRDEPYFAARLLHWETGGHIMFLPVWLLGIFPVFTALWPG